MVVDRRAGFWTRLPRKTSPPSFRSTGDELMRRPCTALRDSVRVRPTGGQPRSRCNTCRSSQPARLDGTKWRALRPSGPGTRSEPMGEQVGSSARTRRRSARHWCRRASRGWICRRRNGCVVGRRLVRTRTESRSACRAASSALPLWTGSSGGCLSGRRVETGSGLTMMTPPPWAAAADCSILRPRSSGIRQRCVFLERETVLRGHAAASPLKSRPAAAVVTHRSSPCLADVGPSTRREALPERTSSELSRPGRAGRSSSVRALAWSERHRGAASCGRQSYAASCDGSATRRGRSPLDLGGRLRTCAGDDLLSAARATDTDCRDAAVRTHRSAPRSN